MMPTGTYGRTGIFLGFLKSPNFVFWGLLWAVLASVFFLRQPIMVADIFTQSPPPPTIIKILPTALI